MMNTITTDLIEAINKQTPVSIDLVPLGYAWSWRCVESAPFPSPQLALIDWINYVCQAYEEVLIESSEKGEKDDPEDDGDDDIDREEDMRYRDDPGYNNTDD